MARYKITISVENLDEENGVSKYTKTIEQDSYYSFQEDQINAIVKEAIGTKSIGGPPALSKEYDDDETDYAVGPTDIE